MRTRWMQEAFLFLGLGALSSVATLAQTDIAASLYGAFTGKSSGNGTIQSSSNAAGGLLEMRHISKPWLGYEVTYSYNRANQNYTMIRYCDLVPTPVSCGAYTEGIQTTTNPVSSNAHEATGDWVASMKIRNLRPFVLAGAGVLFDVPSSGLAPTFTVITGVNGCPPNCGVGVGGVNTNTAVRPVLVYGGGMDWALLPHFGLRFQYRGNLYKAPGLNHFVLFSQTSAITHTAEPMIGIYFRR